MPYLMTLTKFRELTGVSRTECYRHFKRGKLTPIKAAPKCVLVDFDEWNRNFALTPPPLAPTLVLAESRRVKSATPLQESRKTKNRARRANVRG